MSLLLLFFDFLDFGAAVTTVVDRVHLWGPPVVAAALAVRPVSDRVRTRVRTVSDLVRLDSYLSSLTCTDMCPDMSVDTRPECVRTRLDGRLLMRTSYDAPKTADHPPFWGDDAACKDSNPEDFFPPSYVGAYALVVTNTKQVCARCPVATACLRWALSRREPDGIWGGLDPVERAELVRGPASAREAPDAST